MASLLEMRFASEGEEDDTDYEEPSSSSEGRGRSSSSSSSSSSSEDEEKEAKKRKQTLQNRTRMYCRGQTTQTHGETPGDTAAASGGLHAAAAGAAAAATAAAAAAGEADPAGAATQAADAAREAYAADAAGAAANATGAATVEKASAAAAAGGTGAAGSQGTPTTPGAVVVAVGEAAAEEEDEEEKQKEQEKEELQLHGRTKIFSARQQRTEEESKHSKPRQKTSSQHKKRHSDRQQACAIFKEMQEADTHALRNYPSGVEPDDFLLQFHRRCPPEPSASTRSWQHLQHHLFTALSALQRPASAVASSPSASHLQVLHPASSAPTLPATEAAAAAGTAGATSGGAQHKQQQIQQHTCYAHVSPGDVASTKDDRAALADAGAAPALSAKALKSSPAAPASVSDFSIRECKERCRKNLSNATLVKVMQEALHNMENTGETSVKKVVRFAGQIIEVEERMETASAKYQQALEMRRRAPQNLGGRFAGLDGLVAALEDPASINSLQKSQADWEVYKRDKGLSAELAKGHSYLQRQVFLAQTEWKQHEQNVELRRKRQAEHR